ncbi:MAG: polysaccharide deacetylase family protein [Chitinophagaceae bacterium]|nr:polysaccharide deacetylase family protein [Chitinophagaceae bacterium]
MDPDPDEACSEHRPTKASKPTWLKAACFILILIAVRPFSTAPPTGATALRFEPPDTKPVKEKGPASPKKKKKTIYLTFDDGPNKGTQKMMDIVKAEAIPVTLFIIGEHVYGSREQAAVFDSIMTCRYFEIANHSYTHARHNQFAKFYLVPDSVIADFTRCADSLQLNNQIVRTPGRNIWRTATISRTDIKSSATAADSLYAAGFIQLGWDLEWHFDDQLRLKTDSDGMMRDVDSLFANALTKTPNHLVILAHDQVYQDPADSAELHQFILKLKARDEYLFEVVSRYPGLKN